MDGDLQRDVLSRRPDPLIPTVFHEAWWLQAAAGDAVEEVTVSVGGKVVGRLPFILTRLAPGHVLCGMPRLTHFLGPGIDSGRGAEVNRRLRLDGILRELLVQLPATSGFSQKLHRETTDTLVFDELGFLTRVQFSYDVAPAAKSVLWANMRDKTRNVIRRAAEQFQVRELADPAEFRAVYDRNLRDRGRTNHYVRLEAVCGAALQYDRGRILVAIDGAGRIAASIFYVWDARASYYLLTTRGLDAGNGAVSLLIWEAMQDTARRGLVFDFDGVASPGTRVFYSGFGGEVVPRYVVSRFSLSHRVIGRLGASLGLVRKS